jgi:hypothetical protein
MYELFDLNEFDRSLNLIIWLEKKVLTINKTKKLIMI